MIDDTPKGPLAIKLRKAAELDKSRLFATAALALGGYGAGHLGAAALGWRHPWMYGLGAGLATGGGTWYAWGDTSKPPVKSQAKPSAKSATGRIDEMLESEPIIHIGLDTRVPGEESGSETEEKEGAEEKPVGTGGLALPAGQYIKDVLRKREEAGKRRYLEALRPKSLLYTGGVDGGATSSSLLSLNDGMASGPVEPDAEKKRIARAEAIVTNPVYSTMGLVYLGRKKSEKVRNNLLNSVKATPYDPKTGREGQYEKMLSLGDADVKDVARILRHSWTAPFKVPSTSKLDFLLRVGAKIVKAYDEFRKSHGVEESLALIEKKFGPTQRKFMEAFVKYGLLTASNESGAGAATVV